MDRMRPRGLVLSIVNRRRDLNDKLDKLSIAQTGLCFESRRLNVDTQTGSGRLLVGWAPGPGGWRGYERGPESGPRAA